MELKDITQELYQGSKRLEEGSKEIFKLAEKNGSNRKRLQNSISKRENSIKR